MVSVSRFSCDNKFFEKLNSALVKKFDIKKSKDLEKANWLLVCLVALEDIKSAKAFSESYVWLLKDDGRSYARGHQIDALGVLAYLSIKESDDAAFKECMSVIVQDNCDADDLESFIDKVEDELEYYMDQRETLKSMMEELTESEVAMGYCSNILIFSYFYTLLLFKECSVEGLSKKVYCCLEEEISSLRVLLVR